MYSWNRGVVLNFYYGTLVEIVIIHISYPIERFYGLCHIGILYRRFFPLIFSVTTIEGIYSTLPSLPVSVGACAAFSKWRR